MAFEFKLPDIGEGVVEGELTKWLVEDGQEVSEDTPLFEVLTDKVSATIPSPRKGRVSKRHFQEGDMVPVGSVVVTLELAAGAGAAQVAASIAQSPATAATAPVVAPVATTAPIAATRAADDKVRAAPATRKLARELGVELQIVPGTGEYGRVTRDDVQNWASQIVASAASPNSRSASAPTPARPPVAATTLAQGPDEERQKLKGLRRKIYAKMRESKDHAAHFTYVEEVDFTEIIAMQAALTQAGLKTTFLPFVLKAVVLSLLKPEFAYLNAQIDEAAGEIVVKKRYHIGVAAATDPGLVVPVVRDVDRKSIRQLIEEVRELGNGARAGTLPGEALAGSTFTITSLGKIGGMFATPIVNYPESAILGLHKVEPRPVVVDGQIVIRDRMYMSCSFDHRLIDGHVGAAFVQSVRSYLEQPALMLAELA